MIKATTFGFSAFLRLALMNDKPQVTEIKNRHRPNKKGGYDFHWSLHKSINSFCNGTKTKEEILASLAEIKKEPERNSASQGFNKFIEWHKHNGSAYSTHEPIIIESPLKQFKISFQPDFIKELDARRTAVHIWNSKAKLDRRTVLACLSLIANAKKEEDRLDDFSLLSLRDGQRYKWSDDPNVHLPYGIALLDHFDKLCVLARKHHNLPQIDREDRRPDL